MEYKLNEESKTQYTQLVKSAQDLEYNIGQANFRIHKLLNMREQVDVEIRKWWDNLSIELKLDKNFDYMVTMDGNVKQIEKPATKAPKPVEPMMEVAPKIESKIGTNASELK